MSNNKDFFNNFYNNLLDNLDDIDIKEEDYIDVEEELSELDKKRLKKKLKGRINNKKKLIVKVSVSCSLFILVGISSPAIAKNIPIIKEIYSKVGFDNRYKDYSMYIGESKEKDGVKYTIDNLIITKYNLKVAVKVEGDNVAEENKYGIGIKPSMGNLEFRGAGTRNKLIIDEKTVIYVDDYSISNGYPEKGKLNIEILDTDKQDAKIPFEFNVDFKQAFRDSLEKEINSTIKSGDVIVNKLHSSVNGTILFFKDKIEDIISPGGVILKVDNKFYNNNLTVSSENDSYTIFEEAKYSELKEAKDISLLIFDDDYNTSYNYDTKEVEKKLSNKIEDENVRYNKEINFPDGSKADFFKVQWDDKGLKLYFKVNSYEKALCFMRRGVLKDMNIEEAPMIGGYLYKNNEGHNEYVLAFDGLKKDGEYSFEISPNGLEFDKYKLVEKVSLN